LEEILEIIIFHVVNSNSNFTPIQTMMCGAKESSNQFQNKHIQ